MAERDACIRLAGACLEQGDLDAGASALERLLRLDPDNPRHKERLDEVQDRIRREGRQPGAAPEPEPTVTVVSPEPPAPEDASGLAPVDAPVSAAEPVLEIEEEPGVEIPADIEVSLPSDAEDEDAVDADFVAEHMTEAEVFVKYGLMDRAVEQLQEVIERCWPRLPASWPTCTARDRPRSLERCSRWSSR